jgi:hypothetical protein
MNQPATATSGAGERQKLSSSDGRAPVGPGVGQATAESQTILQTSQAFVQAEFSRLLNVFYLLNGAVVVMVGVLAVADLFLLIRQPPEAHYQRLITDKVLIALISASAAQLGLLAVSAGRQVLRLWGDALSLVGFARNSTTAGHADPTAASDEAP